MSCAQAAEAYAEHPGDTAVTWVPLFHDMGLVTGLMRPAYTGYPTVLMTPEVFARSPGEWLRALTECAATLSSAPNFAYELCVRKVAAEQVRRLDLRRWRVARNAGEVVRPQTMARFVRHLRPAGLSPAAMCPSYGLAEATLTVTTCGPGVPARELTVSTAGLDRGRAEPVASPAGSPGVRTLSSSGRPVAGTEVRVEGDAGPLEGAVGQILIRGPQLSPGYWCGEDTPTGPDPDQPWRPTGDLGFVHDGHLYVLGRTDDTIVYQGRNFYLSDLLAACSSIEQIRPGRVAPFLIWDDAASLEIVCLVAEVRAAPDGSTPRLNRLASRVKQALTQALELYVGRVEFVAAGSLPVTTSGKVRASETRRRYLRGELPLCPR
jgi:acyl-CoA synthetase (AMP-forming)/AMP-acid ligase II